MKKTVIISKDAVADRGFPDKMYLYRIAGVSLDKVTLDKHLVKLMSTLEKDSSFSAEMNDETKVGTVTEKMFSGIVRDVSKLVDFVAVDFKMDEKVITSIDFRGVIYA